MSGFDREYFERNYRGYHRHNSPRKLNFYADLVRSHLAARNGAPRILEIGCGFGPFLRALGPDWRKFGVDRSEYAVYQAKAALADAALAVADATQVPFRGPFDAIVSFDVIEHVPDLERAAQSIRGLLADDGVLVFVVPVYDGPLGPIVHLLDKDPTHIHKQSRAFWLDWANRHFQVIEAHGIIRYLLPIGKYLHLHSRIALRFGSAIAVCCRRRTGP